MIGTDTGVGKTQVSVAVLRWLCRHTDHPVFPMKPVATGCRLTNEGYRSEDAERLLAVLANAGRSLPPYEAVNPYALAHATSPHIAAAQEGLEIAFSRIQSCLAPYQAGGYCVLEGIGGLLTPLNARETLADLILFLKMPVVLVVGLRLGCLNHTRLTWEALCQRGIPLKAWVINQLDPAMTEQRAYQETLAACLPAPYLGMVPWDPPGSPTGCVKAADVLNFSALFAVNPLKIGEKKILAG